MTNIIEQNIIQFTPGYKIDEFPWGTAVYDTNQEKYISIHLPMGQEINCENIKVKLNDKGIEIVKYIY